MNATNKSILFLFAVGVIAGISYLIYVPQISAADAANAVATPTPTPKPTPNEEDEIIKIETELVNLNVRVVDRNNRPINNIPERDFRVFEDGVPQNIEFFSKAEVPTNYALVIDNSGSMRTQIDKVIEAGTILVNANRPLDETMVIRFVGSGNIEIIQEFTTNKTEIIENLENMFIQGGATALFDAVYLAVESTNQYEKSPNRNDTKRRAIILVTDGDERGSFYNEKQVFELLQESEVQIYVVGFVEELSKEGAFIRKSPQGKARALLQRLADETGGRAYFPKSTQDLPNIAREISNELRTQYSIGYIPTNDKQDGSFRKIKVEVADGPNKEKRIAVTRAGRTAETARPN